MAWGISILELLSAVQHEIMLFAAVGIAIGGIDDLAIDLLFFTRQTWRRWTVYTRFPVMNAVKLVAREKLCGARESVNLGGIEVTLFARFCGFAVESLRFCTGGHAASSP